MEVEVINNEDGDKFEPPKHKCKKKQKRKDGTCNCEAAINVEEPYQETYHEIKSSKRKRKKRSKMYTHGISKLDSTVNSEVEFAEQLSSKKKKKKHKRHDNSDDDVVEVQIDDQEYSQQTDETNHEIKSSKKKKRSKMYTHGISELYSTVNSQIDFEERLSPKKKKKKHKRQDDSDDDVVEVQINGKKYSQQSNETNHEIKTRKKNKRRKMYSDGISELDATVNSEADFTEQLSKKKKHKKDYNVHEIEIIEERINNIQEITFDQNEDVYLENKLNVSSKKKLKKSTSIVNQSNTVDISNWGENELIELFPSNTKKQQNEEVPDKILQVIDEQINIENNSGTNEIQINSSFENNSELSSTIIYKENNLTEQPAPKIRKKFQKKKNKEIQELSAVGESDDGDTKKNKEIQELSAVGESDDGDTNKNKEIQELSAVEESDNGDTNKNKEIQELSEVEESDDDDDQYKNHEPEYLVLSGKTETLRRRKKMLNGDEFSDEDEFWKVKNLFINIDWDIPPIHQTTQLVSNEKIEIECNQNLKKGAWSVNEELTLVNNWKKFEKEFEIHNPMSLLGLKKKRNKALEELQLNFVRYLGRDLNNRTLISIYQQARRMFDPHNYKGRMSEMEYKIVKRLVIKYGHKWEKIGRKMNRTGESVRYAWEKLATSDKNCGKWAQKEDEALIEALKHVSGCENLKDLGHHNLPWKKVSEIVKTRDRCQCRMRWLDSLSIEYSGVQIKEWTTEQKIKLLEHLNDSDYMCESYIPWEELAAEFGLGNCAKMRFKWNALKNSAPNYYVKTFRENLDWLVINYLPVLRKLKKAWEF